MVLVFPPLGLRGVILEPFGASGVACWSHVRSIFEPILTAFSRLWSSCFSLLLAPLASVLGPESPERTRRDARETSHLASEAALAAEQ